MNEHDAPNPIVPTPVPSTPHFAGAGSSSAFRASGSEVIYVRTTQSSRAGRTFVPILTEQDYYRAELEQIEVFASLVPMDRVWVEEVRPAPTDGSAALDAPPIRHARRPTSSEWLLSRRIIRAVADGFVRDLRAVSGLYPTGPGAQCVRLCSEAEWYAWAFTGRVPDSVEVSALDLWVD